MEDGNQARRNFMKLGAGAAMTVLNAAKGPAQSPAVPPDAITRTGWQNDAHRASGNGPIDNTTRQIVKYVASFSASNLTPALVDAVGDTMLDSMASLIAGFESEPVRICARMSRTIRSDLKCTVLGYGITTSPEMAAFTNGCMLRHADYNDLGPGGHVSDIISGILAVGEAFHSTGTEMLVAIALGYEMAGALAAAGANSTGSGGWDGPYEGPATAMAVGKLMTLNEDQLANALSLTLVPHMPMKVTHVGALSHWKGCHSSESVRCAVFSTLLAREGMTGPAQPFEGRDGLFDHIGSFRDLRLPAASPDGRMIIQRMGFKRFPSEGSTQSVLELTPSIRAWTKPEDIVSLHVELPFAGWQETADPPKWDPKNRETADHSMPYVVAVALIDGDIYLDSFSEKRIQDPAVRRLMDRITAGPDPSFTYQGQARLTARTKSGGELVKETMVHLNTPMTHEEIVGKFDRACAYMSISTEQRDRARGQWLNLGAVHDMAEPMRTLAKFGRPMAL
jgi:2-methylcitrate dehydratase